MVFGQNVTERHRAHNPSPLPCPAAGPGAGRPLRAPVRAAAGSPTCCMRDAAGWKVASWWRQRTARNSRALGCSRVAPGRQYVANAMRAVVPPSGVGARQRYLEVSQCRLPQAAGGVRRDPPAFAARSKCSCSSRHGEEGTSSTHRCRAAAGAVTRGRRTAIVALRHLVGTRGFASSPK